MVPPSTLGALAAFGSSFTWAVGTTSYSGLAARYEGATINFSRASVALPLFLLLGLICTPHGALVGMSATAALWITLIVLTSYAIGDVCFFFSARAIGVPSALAIGSTYPLLSALVAVAWRGEALPLHRACGVLLTVAGTVTVILAAKKEPIGAPLESPHGPASHGYHRSHRRRGVGLAFLTAFFWCMNAIAISEAGRRMTTDWVNVYRMALSLALCPLAGMIIARIQGVKPPRRICVSAADYKKNLWVFALEGFGGALLFTYGLAHAPLSIGPALSALAPVIAVPLMWLRGGEPFFSARTAGVLLVVAGLALL